MQRAGRSMLALGTVVLLTASCATAQVVADGSRLAWGEAEVVASGTRLAGDVVVACGPVTVDGVVTGDVVAVRGDITVRGHVMGDVLAVLGRIVLEPGAVVSGDAYAIGGSVRLPDGAVVSGSARTLVEIPEEREPTWLRLAWSPQGMVLRALCILVWTTLAILAAFLAPTAIVRASEALRGRPLRMTWIGLLLDACLVLAAVLSVALIAVFVGIPLLGLVLVLATLLHSAGLAAAFHALGRRISGVLHDGSSGGSGYAAILLGALVLGAVDYIPYVGLVAWLLAATLGSGAIVVTWRRSP